MKKSKLCSIFAATMTTVLIIVGILSLVAKTSAAPLDAPLVYYNDSTWAREDRSPLKLIDGEYYVPLVLFAQLDDTKVRVNNSLNTFVISHGDLYVSFDASTDIATDTDDNYLYIKTYKLDYGERYVPAQTICEYLDYGFEVFKSAVTGEVAVRITDGTQESDFKDLLSRYNSALLETVGETQSADTTAKPTEPSSTSARPVVEQPTKILGNRIIYLTFDVGINAYTGGILDTLAAYGVKATFFVNKKQLTDYPLTLARLIAEGHSIALEPASDSVEAYTDIDSFISELNATNELLYRIYKQRSRTVRADTLAYANTELTEALYSDKLEQAGYTLWGSTVSRIDGMKQNTAAIDEYIDAIWENNTLVLDFGSNASSTSVLSGVLSFINENRDKCDVRLADPAYPPVR